MITMISQGKLTKPPTELTHLKTTNNIARFAADILHIQQPIQIQFNNCDPLIRQSQLHALALHPSGGWQAPYW